VWRLPALQLPERFLTGTSLRKVISIAIVAEYLGSQCIVTLGPTQSASQWRWDIGSHSICQSDAVDHPGTFLCRKMVGIPRIVDAILGVIATAVVHVQCLSTLQGPRSGSGETTAGQFTPAARKTMKID
jgi:hypothetical protein